jgi:hypothetical protein
MLKDLGGRSYAAQASKVRAIKGWVQEILALPPETTIMVTELTCTEPGCPPLETVIALLRGPGDSAQQKIHRSVAEVTKEDVATLCARFAQGGQASAHTEQPTPK